MASSPRSPPRGSGGERGHPDADLRRGAGREFDAGGARLHGQCRRRPTEGLPGGGERYRGHADAGIGGGRRPGGAAHLPGAGGQFDSGHRGQRRRGDHEPAGGEQHPGYDGATGEPGGDHFESGPGRDLCRRGRHRGNGNVQRDGTGGHGKRDADAGPEGGQTDQTSKLRPRFKQRQAGVLLHGGRWRPRHGRGEHCGRAHRPERRDDRGSCGQSVSAGVRGGAATAQPRGGRGPAGASGRDGEWGHADTDLRRGRSTRTRPRPRTISRWMSRVPRGCSSRFWWAGARSR